VKTSNSPREKPFFYEKKILYVFIVLADRIIAVKKKDQFFGKHSFFGCTFNGSGPVSSFWARVRGFFIPATALKRFRSLRGEIKMHDMRFDDS
jgi:hypothetical protein